MAIAEVGTRTRYNAAGNVDPATHALTVPSGTDFLVVTFGWESARTISEVRLGASGAGSSGTLLLEADASRIQDAVHSEIWYLVAPTIGAGQEIWVDQNASGVQAFEVSFWSGVDQSSPISDAGGGVVNGGETVTCDAALTPSGANDVLLAVMADGRGVGTDTYTWSDSIVTTTNSDEGAWNNVYAGVANAGGGSPVTPSVERSGSFTADMTLSVVLLRPASVGFTATAVASLRPATSSASANTIGYKGTAAALQRRAQAAAVGNTIGYKGTAAATQRRAQAAAVGFSIRSTAAVTQQRATAAAVGLSISYKGAVAATQRPATAAAVGRASAHGTAVAALQRATAAAVAATASNIGAAVATLQRVSAAAVGVSIGFKGAAAAALRPLLAAALGATQATGAAAAALQATLASAAGNTTGYIGTAVAELQRLSTAALGAFQATGAAATELQPATGAASGTALGPGASSSAAVNLKAATATAAGNSTLGTAVATLRALVAAATGELVGAVLSSAGYFPFLRRRRR